MDKESKLAGRYRHSHIEKCHLIKAVISLRQIFIIANHYFAKGTYGNIFLGKEQEGSGEKEEISQAPALSPQNCSPMRK